jgi:hypothetical protein
MWWDPRVREHLPGPRHVYPRFATRGLAEVLRLGAAVQSAARRAAPASRSLVVVTVGGDLAVDNGAAAALARAWRARGTREVECYEFPGGLGLNHDIVDPEQVGANPALTYPVLLRLIGP